MSKVEHTVLPNKYQEFLTFEEEQALSKLEHRADRQKLILQDTLAARRKIIARATKRRRHAEGKS